MSGKIFTGTVTPALAKTFGDMNAVAPFVCGS